MACENPEVQDRRDFENETNLPAKYLPLGAKPMNTLTLSPKTTRRNAFTLIEILIVVVILGILAAVVVPQFTNAADDANDAATRSQLQTLRGQIELYRAQQTAEPTFIANGWDDLTDNNYLMLDPVNPFTGSSTIVGAASGNDADGWVWRDNGNGTFGLYAVASDGTEFNEAAE